MFLPCGLGVGTKDLGSPAYSNQMGVGQSPSGVESHRTSQPIVSAAHRQEPMKILKQLTHGTQDESHWPRAVSHKPFSLAWTRHPEPGVIMDSHHGVGQRVLENSSRTVSPRCVDIA